LHSTGSVFCIPSSLCSSDRSAGRCYWQLLQLFAVDTQNAGGMVPMQPGLQLTAAHAALSRHVTSQAHAEPQLTSPLHAALPVQLTLHAPRPHATVLQVWRALHAIVHDAALPQLTPLLHWLATEHRTLQFQPAGQVIAWLQASLSSAQSIVQVFWAVLHDVHCDGHTAASPSGGGTTPESAATTQNPSTQVRPSAQRCSELQAKSLLRWLIEQPAVSASATVVHSASFMASLRA
jgi:hypothetical protein